MHVFHTLRIQITCSNVLQAPKEAEFGVAGGHGAFPYVAGPGMKLSGRGSVPVRTGPTAAWGAPPSQALYCARGPRIRIGEMAD